MSLFHDDNDNSRHSQLNGFVFCFLFCYSFLSLVSFFVFFFCFVLFFLFCFNIRFSFLFNPFRVVCPAERVNLENDPVSLSSSPESFYGL